MRRIWPRAQSKLYEEPKKLVAHGFARATDDSVGRRRRTRYTITAKGRRALAAWLQEPGDGPILEFEQLLKISFADSGSKADIVANLEATRAWVLEQNEENLATAAPTSKASSAFPERAALNQLAGRFLTDFYVMVAHWVDVGVAGRRGLARRRPRRAVRCGGGRGSSPAGGEHRPDPPVAGQPAV